MNALLKRYLAALRASYWFVPSIMVTAAVAAALGVDYLESRVDTSFLQKISLLYQNQPEGARAVLSAIATSMIGVAGVTFSMTLVSVSFAAANIGPRLIGNFMRDRGNQITLGTFIATFVYCLLVLRTITVADSPDGGAHVPHLAMLTALVLALICVANLIYFIHHIPESINVARIAHQIAEELQGALTKLFPSEVGETEEEGSDSRAPAPPAPPLATQRSVQNHGAGYLQVIDDEALLELATTKNLTLRIQYRPGDFAQDGVTLLYAYPAENFSDNVADQLRNCFAFGPKRTETQDALFLVDQLVEITMRALSPGVNDPFTAVGCMDWLEACLMLAFDRDRPAAHRYDEDGKLRIIVHSLSLERLTQAVFNQPLQYVAADRIAAFRQMQTLAELVTRARSDAEVQLLLGHAAQLAEAGALCLPVPAHQQELQRRYQQTCELATNPALAETLEEDQRWFRGRG